MMEKVQSVSQQSTKCSNKIETALTKYLELISMFRLRLRVRASLEALRCVLQQDTLSSA